MDLQAFDLIRQLAASHYLVRALQLVAELGVADRVAGEPTPVADVATATGANEDALQRILVLLASRGIFRLDNRRVAHTAASELLRGDHPASLRSFVRMFGQRIQWQCAQDLAHAVQSGEAVASRAFPDGGLWGYLEANPAEGQVFGEAMAAKSAVQIADILGAHDFSRYRWIADIGGGHGHMLRAILAQQAEANAVLFDLPGVIEQVAHNDVGGRLSVEAGDFFTTPLPGADAMLLMEVLHDWDDAHCARILNAVRQALPPSGRLLVIEIEMTDGTGPDWPKLLDIVMLAMFSARQRTNAEYRALLDTSGFQVETQVSTPAGMTIIEATAR